MGLQAAIDSGAKRVIVPNMHAETMGGIDFINCFVEDSRERPAIEFTQPESDFPLYDITGTITVLNANGVRAELGKNREKLPLVVREYE